MARFSRAWRALCCAVLFLTLSCSDSAPYIQSVRFRAVFDFKSHTEPPELSAMLFIQPDTDVSLVAEIKLIHEQSDFIWSVTDPVILHEAQTAWAGSAHLVNVPGVFPQGNYRVRYIDVAERASETTVTLAYPQQLIQSTAANALENVPMSSERQVALYDSEDRLIYFGERDRHWTTARNVAADYPAARSYRDCYISQSTAVLMPVETLAP
jgi:hypothetical protein